MTEALEHAAPSRPMHAGNDLLARVPGQFIAQASRSLPDPACAIDDEMQVDIEAGWVGRVRLTFRKQRYCRPRGKLSYVAWLCRHAESLGPSPDVTAASAGVEAAVGSLARR
jgi:hypothetical protein